MRVSAKLEEGDYTGAVHIACSEDSIAVINQETLSELKAKHPPAHPDSSFPPAPESPMLLAEITEREVARAIKSFPCGSAGGRMVYDPSTSKILPVSQLRGVEKSYYGPYLRSYFLCWRAILPYQYNQFNCVTKEGRGGGIRPIAVGQTLRRLVAKCGGFRVVESIRATLAPLQLG